MPLSPVGIAVGAMGCAAPCLLVFYQDEEVRGDVVIFDTVQVEDIILCQGLQQIKLGNPVGGS